MHNSPHGKFERFLFSFSSKFALYVLNIYSFYETYPYATQTCSEPGLLNCGNNLGLLKYVPQSLCTQRRKVGKETILLDWSFEETKR